MDDISAVNAGKLASVYIKIRDKRAELLKAYELEDNKCKEALETIEEELLEKCKAEGCDSIKTPYGTIIRSIKTRYWPADWEIFNQYVIDHEALGLLAMLIFSWWYRPPRFSRRKPVPFISA